jgi:hypothetical protein
VAITIHEAGTQSRLAYEFSPSSYNYSCMSACLAAEQALGVLRDALEEESTLKRLPTNR